MSGIRVESLGPMPSEAVRVQVAVEVARELERRDALLQAVVRAAECFLECPDWRAQLPDILRRLGEAASASRVYVFENHAGEDGAPLTSQRFEWVAPGVAPQLGNPALQSISLRDIGCGRWEEILSAGGVIEGDVATFPPAERAPLLGQQILSLAVVPVFVSGHWWGFIGFDDCVQERSWPATSLAVLKTAGNLLGLAMERGNAQAEAQAGEQRFQRLVEATREGVLIHDGTRVLDINPSGVAMLGCAGAEEVVGRDPFDFLAPESRALAMERARAGSDAVYEVDVLRADGSRFPAEIKGGLLRYRDRLVRFVSVRDLTLRRRAEDNERRLGVERAARAEAEQAEARAEFLAEASRVLSSTFDYETTLARIARLAVPFLADYCLIDVVDGGSLRRIAMAHADPAREPLLRELQRFAPDTACEDNPIVRTLRTRRALVLRRADDVPPAAIAPGCALAALSRELAPRGAMFVPLTVPAGMFGVITFVSTDPGRVFDHADLTLAEELATRTALAVANAQLYHAAQQATRARDEVLSVVAHDLRNPLGVILNGAELLLELGVEDRPKHFAELIRLAASSMNRLIGDLVEVSRIDGGQIALMPGVHAVEAVVEESVSVLRPLAEAREIDLDVRVLSPDARVQVDPARLAQVFSNLVGNALKFTPPLGRIAVVAETVGQDVRFTVADTGPGIPPEDLPHVFGRFWQGNRSDRRGLGLGLAIAKQIVDGHGGRIWVESTPGEGARFYFTVPVARGDGAA